MVSPFKVVSTPLVVLFFRFLCAYMIFWSLPDCNGYINLNQTKILQDIINKVNRDRWSGLVLNIRCNIKQKDCRQKSSRFLFLILTPSPTLGQPICKIAKF